MTDRDEFAEGSTADASAGYLLQGTTYLSDVARKAADRALAAGADHVIASVKESGGITMRARDGAFDTAVRNGSQSMAIQLFANGRTARANTAALADSAIKMAIDRALAITRQIEEDPDAAPPESDWLAFDETPLELFAPSDMSPKALGDIALEIEASALEFEGADIRVMNAGASSNDNCVALAIDRDFCRAYRASSHDTWCSAIAERAGTMTQDWWSASDRRFNHLDPPAQIGARAAERAARKLGARAMASRACPVLFDALVATTLVQDIAAALMGHALWQGTTIWPEGKGTQALAPHLDLVEDPLEAFGLASEPFDSEGVGGARRSVIRGGVIEDYFLSSLYARKLGLRSTGNADGVRNLTLETSLHRDTPSALLGKLHCGLWVTEILGGAVDPATGAYSKAVGGFWVEGGKPVFPVQDITIAGDLRQMLKQIVAVGTDVERQRAFRTGSLLIETMHVSGR